MIICPSDPIEAPQHYTVYLFPFGEGVHGIFVSAEAAKNGTYQTFPLSAWWRNGLFYFTFVPSDTGT